jgi:DNA-directed RNA polymerase subunit E'/Rpb7
MSKNTILSRGYNVKKNQNLLELYSLVLLERTVVVSFTNLGNNLTDILKQKIEYEIEGKCINEGYVKPRSIVIETYSCPILKGGNACFNISFTCMICNPGIGMIIEVLVENVTKAGIKAVYTKNNSPIIVFIARDFHYNNEIFSKITEGSKILVKIIGKKFEINDTFISIMGELDKNVSLLNEKKVFKNKN